MKNFQIHLNHPEKYILLDPEITYSYKESSQIPRVNSQSVKKDEKQILMEAWFPSAKNRRHTTQLGHSSSMSSLYTVVTGRERTHLDPWCWAVCRSTGLPGPPRARRSHGHLWWTWPARWEGVAWTSVTDLHLASACFLRPTSELLLWDTVFIRIHSNFILLV